MSTVFKNKLANNLGSSPTTVLTTSASATTTVLGLSFTNVTSGIILISVQLQDTVASTTAYFVQNVVVPPNTSVRLINGGERLVLGSSTNVIVSSNTASSVDMVLSYVEIS
jgi:hypothetical protein